MQPMKMLANWLANNANNQSFLFTLKSLHGLFPKLSYNAFKTLVSRAVKAQILTRACKGIYLYKPAMPHDGLMLYHIASHLRPGCFNYISLETVLSDAGVISQIPLNYIAIMSSGRSSIITCKDYGTIEFVHTQKRPATLIEKIFYDPAYNFWRANVTLAIQDMKATKRNCDLINWSMIDEFV